MTVDCDCDCDCDCRLSTGDWRLSTAVVDCDCRLLLLTVGNLLQIPCPPSERFYNSADAGASFHYNLPSN